MFEKRKPDVLVVGAGPVGMFAALTLARRGVRVRIVDQEWRTGAHSFALALHPQSLALLDDAGLLGEVLSRAYHIRDVAFYEGETRRGVVSIGDLREDYSFVAVIRQNALEDLLEKALHDRGVNVQWNHHVAALEEENEHVEATVDRLEQSAFGYGIAHMEWIVAKSRRQKVPFVIGADGSYSFVRSALEIEFRNLGMPRQFAVFEFRTDAALPHEMRLVLNGETTSVFWPMSDGFCRWSFEMEDIETLFSPREKDRHDMQVAGSWYPVLREEHLRELLGARAPWFQGSIDSIEWRALVRFDTRLATSFGRNRMWLAGDAAHMTGPAGIQSMNVGLQEAHELATAMADILQGRASPNVLSDYNHRNLQNWRFLLGLDGLMEPGPEAPDWVHRYSDSIVSALPASGDNLRMLARQLGIEAAPVRA